MAKSSVDRIRAILDRADGRELLSIFALLVRTELGLEPHLTTRERESLRGFLAAIPWSGDELTLTLTSVQGAFRIEVEPIFGAEFQQHKTRVIDSVRADDQRVWVVKGSGTKHSPRKKWGPRQYIEHALHDKYGPNMERMPANATAQKLTIIVNKWLDRYPFAPGEKPKPVPRRTVQSWLTSFRRAR
jgi:hypothetical protein